MAGTRFRTRKYAVRRRRLTPSSPAGGRLLAATPSGDLLLEMVSAPRAMCVGGSHVISQRA